MSAPSSSPVPSITEWLRLLYGDILFPGAPTDGIGRPSMVRWALLACLGLAVCLAGMNMPLLEPDETRYAQIPREMLDAGTLTVPLLDGEPYYDKPPLFYWAVASSYRLLGETIPAARLVPALSVFATILLAYAIGTWSLGEAVGWRGAVLLALAPGLVGMGKLLLLDGLLTLVVFAGQSALWLAAGKNRFHRGWWGLATCLAGVGLLTKGPIALLLMGLPLFVHRWLIPAQGVGPTWKAWLGLGLGASLIALPWHVELAWQDPQFLKHYLWEHHILRFLQPFDHVRGTFFYVPVLAAGLLPGSFLLVNLGKNLAASDEESRSKRTEALGYWLLCAGACIGFFSLSGCKLPTYVLPAFPAFALVLGYAAQGIPQPWWRLGVACWMATLLFGLYMVLPAYAGLRSPLADEKVLAFLDQELGQTGTGLVAYPRPCHSVSWRLNRPDIRHFRSKDFDAFRVDILSRPRTVVLCTHRHSLQGLKQLLPPFVKVSREIRCEIPDLPLVPQEHQKAAKKLLGETALGLCDVAVLEVTR
jgi:4-amino-4-deoxy-L-arabinose transferase-like glycosyltransferase